MVDVLGCFRRSVHFDFFDPRSNGFESAPNIITFLYRPFVDVSSGMNLPACWAKLLRFLGSIFKSMSSPIFAIAAFCPPLTLLSFLCHPNQFLIKSLHKSTTWLRSISYPCESAGFVMFQVSVGKWAFKKHAQAGVLGSMSHNAAARMRAASLATELVAGNDGGRLKR